MESLRGPTARCGYRIRATIRLAASSRVCFRRQSVMDEGRDAHDNLKRDKHDHNPFQKNVPPVARFVGEEAVHIAKAGKLRIDLFLPVCQAETRGGRTIDARIIRIADNLEGVTGAIDELEHVDDEVAQRFS